MANDLCIGESRNRKLRRHPFPSLQIWRRKMRLEQTVSGWQEDGFLFIQLSKIWASVFITMHPRSPSTLCRLSLLLKLNYFLKAVELAYFYNKVYLNMKLIAGFLGKTGINPNTRELMLSWRSLVHLFELLIAVVDNNQSQSQPSQCFTFITWYCSALGSYWSEGVEALSEPLAASLAIAL